jgi:ribulose-phosphate 3-epimerase
MALIFPSLISADLLNLEKELKALDPYCPGYHMDCMDYHFVPNLTWGPSFLEAIASKTTRQLWVHLMVDNPALWVENLSLPPQTIITLHIETIRKDQSIIKRIKDKNWLPSLALNPDTDLEQVIPFIPQVYQILVMSVNPGFSGQQFIETTKDKVQALAAYRRSQGLDFKIAMDGGISVDNIKELTAMGVDHFAVAQAIFGALKPVEALKELSVLAK